MRMRKTFCLCAFILALILLDAAVAVAFALATGDMLGVPDPRRGGAAVGYY